MRKEAPREICCDQTASVVCDDCPRRTEKDYAIEFGGYLADSAEQLLDFLNKSGAAATIKDQDGLTDHWRGLQSAIYEFRKRACTKQTSMAVKTPRPS